MPGADPRPEGLGADRPAVRRRPARHPEPAAAERPERESPRGTSVPSDLAMRAREVGLPTAADLAEAEAELVVVHRHYVPDAPLIPRSGRDRGSDRGGRRRPKPEDG